jgi:hypothetical protein
MPRARSADPPPGECMPGADGCRKAGACGACRQPVRRVPATRRLRSTRASNAVRANHSRANQGGVGFDDACEARADRVAIDRATNAARHAFLHCEAARLACGHIKPSSDPAWEMSISGGFLDVNRVADSVIRDSARCTSSLPTHPHRMCTDQRQALACADFLCLFPPCRQRVWHRHKDHGDGPS